jgi:hypothetical protein
MSPGRKLSSPCSLRNSAPNGLVRQRSRPPCSGSMNGEIAMKTITSALVALLLIAGVAGTAQAFDAKTFYEQADRNHN